MSISAEKTIVNTEAEVFAGSSVMMGRQWMRVRNMDDCVACVIGGQTLEPGEYVEFSFSSAVAETVMGYSKGRSVTCEVVEA